MHTSRFLIPKMSENYKCLDTVQKEIKDLLKKETRKFRRTNSLMKRERILISLIIHHLVNCIWLLLKPKNSSLDEDNLLQCVAETATL